MPDGKVDGEIPMKLQCGKTVEKRAALFACLRRDESADAYAEALQQRGLLGERADREARIITRIEIMKGFQPGKFRTVFGKLCQKTFGNRGGVDLDICVRFAVRE